MPSTIFHAILQSKQMPTDRLPPLRMELAKGATNEAGKGARFVSLALLKNQERAPIGCVDFLKLENVPPAVCHEFS